MIAADSKTYRQTYYQNNKHILDQRTKELRRRKAARNERDRIQTPQDVSDTLAPEDRLKFAIVLQLIRDARIYTKCRGKISPVLKNACVGHNVETLSDGLNINKVKDVLDFYGLRLNPDTIVRICKSGTLYKKLESSIADKL